MAGIGIFAVGAVVGIASKWGFDKYVLKQVRWPSWRGEEADSGTIVLEDLKKVTGIGSGYAGQLNKAGILNYADLAAQTPERLQEIVGSVGLNEIISWIDQAKALTQEVEASEMTVSIGGEMAQPSASA